MIDLAFFQESAFSQLAGILVLAGIVGFICLPLRQPMIVSYIVVGLLAGPQAFNLIHSYEAIDVLAELGVAVLLFLVGLKLDVNVIRTQGLVALVAGLGQVVLTAIIGYFIGLSLGFDAINSIYISVALTFSSTIIIVKMLSDRKETESLHGRIAIGILIVQDLVVVLCMIALSTFGAGNEADRDSAGAQSAPLILATSAVALVLLGLFIRYLATPLLKKMASSSELLITFGIAWAALFAALGHHFGFSKELGGLLAGVSLASTQYREAIISRLASLRDFLLLFFFIALGAKLDLSQMGAQIIPSLIFSLFVLLGNPLIVVIVMGYLGYRKRTSFIAGLMLAQISEFSLILIAMGHSIGHVSQETLSLVTLVGIITIAISVYFITYSQKLYEWSEPLLRFFERKNHLREEEDSKISPRPQYDAILIGLGRFGSRIAKKLKSRNWKLLVVDFNPNEIHRFRLKGYDTLYGDASDHDFAEHLPLQNAKWVVSAMPQHDLGFTHEDPRLVLLEGLKSNGFKGKTAITTYRKEEVETFKDRGAKLVFLPFEDAADEAVDRIIEDSPEQTQAEPLFRR